VPRLIHLNGPPGIGKSTLAQRYVADHPLAFCLDIDGFRRLIGGWDEHASESGRLARRMALAMAREHLTAGYDVVVPQLLARPEFALELRDLASATGAAFHEIVLLDFAADAASRFAARADDEVWALHHAEAVDMLEAAGGFVATYERLVAAIPSLPDAVVITTRAAEIDNAYAALLAAVAT
jgi:predicted kinase